MYSMRRIKIMRAIGNLKNEDAFRIVYKRVNTFKLDYQMTNSMNKLSTVGGGAAATIDDTETDKDTL